MVRSRNSLVPAIQMTVCAVGAYAFAEYVLGHSGPLFAATSSLIALGFSREPRLRRVMEVGLGCTIGIAVGDLLRHWLGGDIWVAAVVLLISILLARFLDSGNIFTTQLGLQSLLVVLLPAPAGGPFTRSIDAIVGGLFALLFTVLVPKDPRREPRKDVQKLLHELAEVLRDCASALTNSDSTEAWHALVRGRNCQPLVDAMRQSLRASGEVATLAPAYRRHRDEIGRLEQSLDYIDLALRNSRVFARRLTSAINHAALSDEATENIAEVLQETAAAIDELSLGLDGNARRSPARPPPDVPAGADRNRRPAAPADAGRAAARGRNGGHAVPPADGGPARSHRNGLQGSPGHPAAAVARPVVAPVKTGSITRSVTAPG
jgi:uncharacterized membrane protein YgaE (UPF0421/DUF939 family)